MRFTGLYKWEDKGPSFTKMTRQQYISAGEHELENGDFYDEVQSDPSKEIKKDNDKIIQEMLNKGEISAKVAEFLENGGEKLSKFYHLLKTHKIPPSIEDPIAWLDERGFPIRGIISGRGGPSERLAGFVDHFLQPRMKSLPSFLQDTKQTLQIIEQINERIEKGEVSLDGVGLATMDLEKMYNNMPEQLGREACKTYVESTDFEGGGVNEPQVSARSIMKALDLCIRKNFFEFNGKIYKQTRGVGTGIKLAPTYACIGMGDFEKLAFNSNQELLDLVILWKRYIDDVFSLFKGSKTQLEELVNWLNSLMPGIVKFTYNFSMEKNRIFGFGSNDRKWKAGNKPLHKTYEFAAIFRLFFKPPWSL